MTIEPEITIVSGLPRSGTSLMMQMLAAGGMEIVTDEIREADVDNPRGYFEFETVKKIESDASWLPATRGKCFKMVSQLLYHLPSSETYRVLFMRRNMEEILDSQEKMLVRRKVEPAPREQIRESYALHLDQLFQWLGLQTNFSVLEVHYNDVLRRPEQTVSTVHSFLKNRPRRAPMLGVIDPALYRNRQQA
jgi:hypothetical protein